METKRVTARPRRRQPEPEQPTEPAGAELLEDIDELLDDIDAVLEHNALEVVRRYRQQGGE